MARTPKPAGRKFKEKGTLLNSKRPTAIRELRPRFLIVCEGEKTEPNYFRGFRVNADVKVTGLGQSPRNIVKYAETLSRTEKYSDIWLVFDRDEFSADEFTGAIEQAKRNDYRVAYSNPAFEVWYLLHFEYHLSALSPQQYLGKLSDYLGIPYRKNDSKHYALLQSRQKDAIANAGRLLASYENHQAAEDSPCTTVHLLVQELNRYLR